MGRRQCGELPKHGQKLKRMETDRKWQISCPHTPIATLHAVSISCFNSLLWLAAFLSSRVTTYLLFAAS